ncbi:flagellar associated isoform A [Chlorella sorokiniana]|uniref:Flagellar associated isoform A n=1 Tax=Chlorella sorokiniana TaxID=3076 RepID=A0A2P6TEG0_CHLSO|nr:flagellar associated isoform A [Chlorella sorokiniana]|eukprot:PRW21035.1 flagellar associated isoform A [Chlorella sorokiniana]
MVLTRAQGRQEYSEFALLDALLEAGSARATFLLEQGEAAALVCGPSNFTPLHAAALTDCHRLIAPLVEAGAAPNEQIAHLDGAGALSLRRFLVDHSRLPSSKLCAVFRGVTPLHVAAWLGHQATCSALLAAGADPEVACLEGRTALAIACYFLDCRPKRSLAIIKDLLAAGADPLCADFHGISALVLSPHCPAPIQKILLDQILLKYGGIDLACQGTAATSAASAAGVGAAPSAGAGSGDGSSGVDEAAAAAAADQPASAAVEAEEEGVDAPAESEAAAEAAANGELLLQPDEEEEAAAEPVAEDAPEAAGDAAGAGLVAGAAAGAAVADELAAVEGAEAAGQAAAAAAAPQEQQAQQAQQGPPPQPPLRLLHELPPERHMDVLQAALCSKHWPVFDFFLGAASPSVQYPLHAVSRLLSICIYTGDVSLVQRVLRSGLRADAAGVNSQGHPHVAVAAVHGYEGVLDALCAAGGTVSLKALHHAADMRSMQGLRLLLARGRPPVLSDDTPVHIGGAHGRSGELCVMLRLLRDTAFRLRYCYRSDQRRHAAESLALVECLSEAGYRPTVYPQAIVHSGWIDLQGRLVSNYDPTQDKPVAFDLEGVNRYTWLAAKREPWSPQRHRYWPPRFQAAVQQLLLLHHTGRAGTGEGSGGPLTRGKRARLDLLQRRITPTYLGPVGGTAAAAAAASVAAKPAAAEPAALQPAAAAAKAGGGTVAGRPVQPRGLKRGRAAAEEQAPLALLPKELLLRIIAEAAYPISDWV